MGCALHAHGANGHASWHVHIMAQPCGRCQGKAGRQNPEPYSSVRDVLRQLVTEGVLPQFPAKLIPA